MHRRLLCQPSWEHTISISIHLVFSPCSTVSNIHIHIFLYLTYHRIIIVMFASIFKPLAIGVFLCASSASAIDNWDITYQNFATDFSDGSTNEAELNYHIGTGRTSYQVALFNKGCAAAITGTTVVKTEAISELVPVDADLQNLEVLLDFDKQTMASAGSSIYNSGTQQIELCVQVQLLDSGSNVIKEDQRDIEIAFDFNVDFATTSEANLQAATLGTATSTASVDSYVTACTCDDETSFTCTTGSLAPDSLLNICVSSTSTDMQIDKLNNIKIAQGAEEFVIIDADTIQDAKLSSTQLVPAKNGAHVASVIPSKFFSYSGTSTAAVSGIVYLKLVGTRRKLAVKISGYPKVQTTSYVRALKSDEDEVIFNRADALNSSAKKTLPDNQVDEQVADQFSFDLQLDRKALEVTEEHINGATMANGFLAFAATIGAFGIML